MEFVGADSGIVCAETLDCLFFFVLVEKTCGFDAIVEFPVDEGGRDDGEAAEEEEDTGDC